MSLAPLSGQGVKKELKSITRIGAITIIALLGAGSLGATFWAFALTGSSGFEEEPHTDKAVQVSEMDRLKALVTNYETLLGMWGQALGAQQGTIEDMSAKVATLQDENAKLKVEIEQLKGLIPVPPTEEPGCRGADYECMPTGVVAPQPEPAEASDYSNGT